MTGFDTTATKTRTASFGEYRCPNDRGVLAYDAAAERMAPEEKVGKIPAAAKFVGCVVVAILLALMAPVLAEGLNPGELISAAGFPSVIGAILADGAVLLLMAMAGVALLGAVRALGLAFGLAIDLSALESPLFTFASQKLGLVVSGIVGVVALFAGVNGLFNLMVDHGLNAALATRFLIFAAICAIVLIVFWLVVAFSSRSFGVALSFAQYIIRSGGLCAMVVLFLSVALAPILFALIIGVIGLAIGVAMVVAAAVICIALLPYIIQIFILACRD